MILTHNRDEDYKRKTSETLVTEIIDGVEATFPLDLLSRGTWILTSAKFTTAILNGADHFHLHQPPYRHSRGRFPFILLEFDSTASYAENLNLENIEPFTQIIISHFDNMAHELQWDGRQMTLKEITTQHYITSSATLYAEAERSEHRKEILRVQDITSDNMAQIHNTLLWSYKPELAVIKTTSVTQIVQNSELKKMKFMRLTKNVIS